MQTSYLSNLLNFTGPEPTTERNLYTQVVNVEKLHEGLEVVFNAKGFAGTWLAQEIEKNYPNAEMRPLTDQGRHCYVKLEGPEAATFKQAYAEYQATKSSRTPS